MMRIVIDENMPVADTLFSGFGEIVRLPGRLMTAEQVAERLNVNVYEVWKLGRLGKLRIDRLFYRLL